MKDLFDWNPPPKYPDAPGFKERTTSLEAARKVAPRANAFCERIKGLLRSQWPGGLTPDEVAMRIGRSPFYVRPRMSEMRARGEIVPIILPNGKPFCRVNDSGMSAAVMTCKPEEFK